MAQTHRERVRSVLAGEKPDFPLTDLGGRVASLNTSTYLNLKRYLGYGDQLEGESVTFLNTIGTLDERILLHFEVPFRRVYLRLPQKFVLRTDPNGMFYDEWGVGYLPTGEYNERVFHPLADAHPADLDDYPWPDPDDPTRIRGLAQEAQALYHETEVALCAGHISAGIFQDCWNLRGMERFLMDMALEPVFAHKLLDRVMGIHIGMWRQFLSEVGGYVEVVETADDLAGQKGLLISPEMYREFIKPRHSALNRAIRELTDAKILYHSCGALRALIPDLIDSGVQILNPIQPLPGLMDPGDLNDRFGDRLVFHGGLDVQKLLIAGTPQEVQAHVRHYLEVLGPERYIIAPANSIQPGTPPENIAAAFEAAREWR